MGFSLQIRNVNSLQFTTQQHRLGFPGVSGKEVQGNWTSKIYYSINRQKTGRIDNPLHTAWYINDKGDKIWLKFDSSIPCNMFPTFESRFYKPKLHKIVKDPYSERKTRDL